MINASAKTNAAERSRFVQRGRRLEYFTIFWNSLEALAALISGFIAGSVALVGYGLDSLIEVTSGAALLWRLQGDKNTLRREAAEQLTLRIVGSCFLLLSAYIAYDSLSSLVAKEVPARSLPGIVIAVASLIAMPLLARAKRRVGVALGSAAMTADARQTDFCTYLSAILLGGLVLNTFFACGGGRILWQAWSWFRSSPKKGSPDGRKRSAVTIVIRSSGVRCSHRFGPAVPRSSVARALLVGCASVYRKDVEPNVAFDRQVPYWNRNFVLQNLLRENPGFKQNLRDSVKCQLHGGQVSRIGTGRFPER